MDYSNRSFVGKNEVIVEHLVGSNLEEVIEVELSVYGRVESFDVDLLESNIFDIDRQRIRLIENYSTVPGRQVRTFTYGWTRVLFSIRGERGLLNSITNCNIRIDDSINGYYTINLKIIDKEKNKEVREYE